MKVKIIKDHHIYSGTVEVDNERGNYLIATGVAETVAEKDKKDDAKSSKPAKKSK